MKTSDATFTLEELSNEVARQIQERGLSSVQRDARVSAAPDARTIRYYTTLGLIDTPLTIGRQAHYKPRHVLQILAIKALQSVSLSLAEIQSRLYGRTDEELEAMLQAASSARTQPTESIHPVYWREITIEPGLKLLADEAWTPTLEPSALENRLRAALAALQAPSQRGTRRNEP